MSDKQQELLSALFDGETSEFETRRLLQELDGEHKSRWQSYQLIRDTANNKVEADFISIDVSSAVSKAIAEDPAPVSQNSEQTATNTYHQWFKPAIGFAAAASIAFVAVFSLQDAKQGEMIPISSASSFVANGKVSTSQLDIQSGVGLSAVSGSAELPLQQQITEINEQKRIEKKRLDYFFNQHAQQSTFNNNRGLMPMARMATEE